MNRPLAILLCLLAPGLALRAQDLARQPTAFTAWIDFQQSARTLPIWIERVEQQAVAGDSTQPAHTVYRIRFRRFTGLVDKVLLRVYFQDASTAQPTFSAWDEIGNSVFHFTLGQGLDLPSCETVYVPMKSVDYVDIDVPDNGSVRGVLAFAIRSSATYEAMDFGGTPPYVDLFGNASPAVTGSDDMLLLGRVKATLEPGVVSLAGGGAAANPGAAFEVPLDRAPLLALLTFEVLNGNISAPPGLAVNGRDAGPASITVADLADPALSGEVEPARGDVVYRYGGWLKCQKVIPGSLLVAGTNQLIISTPGDAAPVALRSVELQLKYTPAAPNP